MLKIFLRSSDMGLEEDWNVFEVEAMMASGNNLKGLSRFCKTTGKVGEEYALVRRYHGG
jgi:hypothetical protein